MHAHVILVRRETLLYIPYRVMDASTVSYIDVSVVIDMLLQSLRANDAQDFIVMGRFLLLVLSTALTIIGLGLIASRGGTVICLFLAGAHSVSCNSGCLHIHYLLPLAVLQAPSMLLGLKGYVHTAFLGPWQMSYILCMNVPLLQPLGQQYASLFRCSTDTERWQRTYACKHSAL